MRALRQNVTANGTSTAVDPVADLSAQVAVLTQQVKVLSSWDDRLGSALKRSWHWRWLAFGLVIICALLAWDRLKLRVDVLPYLYVVDMDGEVLWKGIPGEYRIHDAFVLNHLADWVVDVRSRYPDLVVMQKAWDRAVKMTAKDSEARAKLSAYMIEEDPRKATTPPRRDVNILTKKIKSSDQTSGEYRLSWQEYHIGPNGQLVKQPTYEADFTVELRPPRTRDEAERTNRYGIVLTRVFWSEVIPIGG